MIRTWLRALAAGGLCAVFRSAAGDGHGTGAAPRRRSRHPPGRERQWQDALVKLLTPDREVLLLHAYVRASSTVTFEGIRAGTYQLWFSQGESWDGDKFTCHRTAYRFVDPLEFSEVEDGNGVTHSTWEVSLQAVPGGTAPTRDVDVRTFDAAGSLTRRDRGWPGLTARRDRPPAPPGAG